MLYANDGETRKVLVLRAPGEIFDADARALAKMARAEAADLARGAQGAVVVPVGDKEDAAAIARRIARHVSRVAPSAEKKPRQREPVRDAPTVNQRAIRPPEGSPTLDERNGRRKDRA